MKALLDTHTFIWWDSEPERLSATALAICQDPANTLLFSAASVWEIMLKHQVGKLSLSAPLPVILGRQCAQNGMILLPVEVEHVLRLDELPMHHRDPFDRLLIAQAQVETATLLSCDTLMRQYNVPMIW
jgi:PIN domain nuclease of toxin-antitoxin system